MPHDDNDSRNKGSSYSLYWFGSAILAVGFALGAIIYPPSLGPVAESQNALTLFMGRFHPIVLHVPVGILLMVFVLEMLCLKRDNEEKWGPAALLALFLCSVGMVAAIILGLQLARSGGYDSATFYAHQTFCFVLGIVTLLALFLRLRASASGTGAGMGLYRVTLMLMGGLITVGAHFGANMVHGSKYLTEYAPANVGALVHQGEEWLLSFFARPSEKSTEPAKTEPTPNVSAAGAEEKLMFRDVMLPLLESRCNSCHNADKDKGDLRMDSYELLLKGGEEAGKALVPGKPAESLIVTRVELPEDDDDHMPPEGKDQMTPEELALLKWWVQSGASPTVTVTAAKVPAEHQPLVDKLLTGSK